MDKVTTVGLDLAKSVFSILGSMLEDRWCCAGRSAETSCSNSSPRCHRASLAWRRAVGRTSGRASSKASAINRIRGLLAECGFVLPQRAVEVRRAANALAEHLPTLAR